MASIQRRPSDDGDRYRVGYRQDGKLRWTHTVDTAEGAVEMKDLIERLGPDLALATIKARSGRDVERGVPLLRDLLERHLESVASARARGTAPEYRRVAERTWLPRLGAYPVDAITREAVEKWVGWQREQETVRSARKRARAVKAGEEPPARETYAPKSIANAHGILSSVLALAVEQGWTTKNVAKGVPLPHDVEDAEHEIFTEDEFRRFWAAMQDHYRPLVAFLVATGVRIGEATALQVGDVELGTQHPNVRIRRAWKHDEHGRYLGAPKSRRAKRVVVIDAPVVAILGPLVKGRDADELLFTAKEGGRIHAHRFRERQWQRALDAAKITKHLTPHSLRHTSASWSLMGGVPAQVVQHRLGHESLSTTSKVYAHLLIDAQVAASQVSSRALSPVVPAAPQLEA